MLDLQLDNAEAAQPAGHANKLLAQGVQCGSYALAFNFDWARQIVDEFDLVPIPRAPFWVLGAVNVNGLIVPVVDISNYFSQDTTPSQLQRGQRLLLGGVQAEDAESALAIVFSQTPAQLEYDAQPIGNPAELAPRLQEVCKGMVVTEQGKVFIEIDPQRLMDALAAELSVI
jgi:chemotaxis signal transduction protein